MSGVGRVVVVGAGLAGARTCAELRSLGYTGELVLLGAETHPPYDRPPLSKALLTDDTQGHPDVALDPEWYADTDLRLGVRATGLHPGTVETTAGPVDWDALVLAVGAVPVRLPSATTRRKERKAPEMPEEPEVPSTHLLRTVDDALRLRAALTPGARVVVVGAGWIGAEVTTAALRRGCAVTVVEAADVPLAVPLGPAVGARIAPWYAQAGATLRTGARVAEVGGDGVTLETGEHLAADVVVEGVGVRRDLAWLDGSGVDRDGGVLVDASCRTSVPSVFAVGDCAARWSPRAGRRFLLEHWDDALQAPATAARVILGDDSASYDPVPYVWSEQFGRYVQWAGWRDGEPAVWRGDPSAEAGWAAAWLDDGGRLTGFLAVDRQRDLLQARRLIAAEHRPDPDRLADPAIPLKQT